MTRKTTAFTLLVLLIVLSLCFVACSKKETVKAQKPTGFVPKLDPNTSCSITVAGHYSNFEALEAEFNRFNLYYPNVKMTYVYMDGYSKSGSRILSTALAGVEAPDIFFTYPYMYDWVDGKEITAASENLADPALGLDLSCIRSALLQKEQDGSILSIPIYTTTYGMLVNEDIFEKEKIAVPQTYSELIAACETLKKAGYDNPIMCYSKDSDLLYPLFYPYFCAQIKNNAKALEDLNGMKPEAGEYMRNAMELTADFMSYNFINLEECDKLANNYEAVILRFFEGDVPIMLSSGNTVSGTEKREAKSESFMAHPFRYSFYPVPSTQDGGYFINIISLGFGVNKNGRNTEMANEFMRFLVNTEELNLMAKAKRMVTPCVEISLDSVYLPFQKLNEQHFINQSDLGLEDKPASQVSKAGWHVATGNMTVEEAVASYGSIQ